MNTEIKEKIPKKEELNSITHSVRAAQAVLQYGVGAMVDFPDQTLITAAPEYWNEPDRIYDDRFAKTLSVDYFALPKDISYARFPEWYFCPRCRKFQSIDKWIAEYRKTAQRKTRDSDPYMIKHIRCVDCRKQDLVVTRIVTVCERGHINDFPWVEWVHKQSKRQKCAAPSLKFITSGAIGLDGLSVRCSCGASASLRGAFDKDVFKKLDQETGGNSFRCAGNHPHKNVNETCNCYPRTVQRGSSSVYFPVTRSSLVIPPYADEIYQKIEKSKAFDDCVTILEDEEPSKKNEKINERLDKWSEKIALEIGTSIANVKRILEQKWLEPEKAETDVTSITYRAEEYTALNGEVSSPKGNFGDFVRTEMNISEYSLPHIKAVSLIEKLRVVNALVGFSRITPVTKASDAGFVHIKEPKTNWYPAYEVRGEGIFIEFEQADIDTWQNQNPLVLDRAKQINDNYSNSFIGRNNPRSITPKFVLLHTLAHLLIKHLSFECGYSIASLSERIYCADADEHAGKPMAGILIYTASGDSEGTLGGLVRQGRPDTLPKVFRKAIKDAETCSNDPICILSGGQGRESLNLAACHACALLPETCCEERNAFLDRGLVVGTFENRNSGFYNNITG